MIFMIDSVLEAALIGGYISILGGSFNIVEIRHNNNHILYVVTSSNDDLSVFESSVPTGWILRLKFNSLLGHNVIHIS